MAVETHRCGISVAAGSTMKGEEILVLSAFRRLKEEPNAVLLLAPAPGRFAEVEQLLHQQSVHFVKRSDLNSDGPPDTQVRPRSSCLTRWGARNTVRASRGGIHRRSLVPTGGHNPLEPALHKRWFSLVRT